jgi:hypothetical protein
MSKIGEPYRCDGPSCGKLRDTDANHWWLIRRTEQDGAPHIVAMPWRAPAADTPGTNHVCGIDCLLKVTGIMAQEIIEGIRRSPYSGKEATDAKP